MTGSDDMLVQSFQALKLDATYRPVGVVPSIEALVYSLMGKATILESHNRKINSAHCTFHLPSVVVLNRVAKRAGQLSCDRKNVYIRDGGCCQYCGKKVSKKESTLDHVLPKSRGGVIRWNNVVLSCFSCNQKKGNRTPQEASMKLRREPKPLTYHQYLASISLDTDVWKDYI